MATRTEIANLALSHIGHGQELSDADTDNSREAKAFRRVYSTARKKALSFAPWPFSKKVVALSLISDTAKLGWQYQYQYPSDCERFIDIVSETWANDTPTEYQIPFRRMGDEIWTNQVTASGRYIFDDNDPSRYTSEFTLALSYLVASLMAPSVAGGDNFGLKQSNFNTYMKEIAIAAATEFNSEKRGKEPLGQFIRVRR